MLLTQWRFGLAAALVALCAGWVFAPVPGGEGQERLWTPPESLAGNAYVFVALAVPGLPGVRLVRARQPAPR
ncbi:hypothetical protein SAMN05216188_12130 [Lentzea xinjiangensis]|uniref:Uncharacterized protein n=1 Tax=Lentzea xinjiangensis TaxID=402600 RepID=A0A1H9UCL0_9PSEU|nr:hypothetical protein [Lentzea xinjiangensis]SES07186.1 hypothetical protein SAMN05216188_12130 [Lentzea xinjiangensis]